MSKKTYWFVRRWRGRGREPNSKYDFRLYLTVAPGWPWPSWSRDRCKAKRFKSAGDARGCASLWRGARVVKCKRRRP